MIFQGLKKGLSFFNVSHSSHAILLYCLLIVLLLLLPLSFSPVTVIFAGDLSSITPTTSSILLSSQATNDDEEPLLVLEGVTLIDGTANSPKPNSLIIIRGDKIAAVTNETGHHDELLSFVNS